MANIALNKPVEEGHKNASVVTNGHITGYTGNAGFCEFGWPDYLTVDLKGTFSITCIRFLLWDGLGMPGSTRNRRRYKFRLLTSCDHVSWNILYQTEGEGFNGWQVFRIPSGLDIHYIRLHGLFNSAKANLAFHVVELQAFDKESDPLDAEIVLDKVVTIAESPLEIDDNLPIQQNFKRLISELQRIRDESSILNPKPIESAIRQLRQQVQDMAAIERSLESIKRHITDPVEQKLRESALLSHQSVRFGRFSFWGFWVGLIGGILAIISIILNLIK
ncbi:MAG: discoidin domain-containing protein [Planctomycetes bacterium]|nr:discoidin domain-containing protein [Planctomycetota bacterium]